MSKSYPSKWMQTGVEELRRKFPYLSEDVPAIASRLAELLYERLPQGTRIELGEADGVLELFSQEEGPDASVGYTTFLERGRQAIACAKWEGTREELEVLARQATDCFLRAAGGAMDETTRSHIKLALPHDIQDRMFA